MYVVEGEDGRYASEFEYGHVRLGLVVDDVDVVDHSIFDDEVSCE
jgi:hypothetical protein